MSPSPPEAAQLELSVERLPGSRAQLKVVAAESETERGLSQALRHLGQRYRFPGFRPGRAPEAVVERAVGWPALRQHAIDDLLPELFARALAQAELEPVSSPEVSEVVLERGQPFSFTASVVVRPEIELGDYGAIRVPLEVPAVAEADVDSTLEALRQRYAQLSDASDREARAGDVVTAELTMRHGEEVIGSPDQLQTLDLERGELLPGMADQLIGARVGEPLELVLTLPQEYAREELRGEMVTISANVKQVQAKELPPLDDNLAAIAGQGENLEQLRQYVREQLTLEARQEAERGQQARVLEALVGLARVEVPEPMIQAEIDRELRDLELGLQASGITVEQLLSSEGKSLEQFRGEQRQPAVERVQLELALEEVARREGLQVSDQELDQNLRRIFARGSSREARARAREPLRREMLRGAARRRLLELAGGGEVAQPPEG